MPSLVQDAAGGAAEPDAVPSVQVQLMAPPAAGGAPAGGVPERALGSSIDGRTRDGADGKAAGGSIMPATKSDPPPAAAAAAGRSRPPPDEVARRGPGASQEKQKTHASMEAKSGGESTGKPTKSDTASAGVASHGKRGENSTGPTGATLSGRTSGSDEEGIGHPPSGRGEGRKMGENHGLSQGEVYVLCGELTCSSKYGDCKFRGTWNLKDALHISTRKSSKEFKLHCGNPLGDNKTGAPKDGEYSGDFDVFQGSSTKGSVHLNFHPSDTKKKFSVSGKGRSHLGDFEISGTATKTSKSRSKPDKFSVSLEKKYSDPLNTSQTIEFAAQQLLQVKVSPGPHELFLSGILTSLAPIGESCGSHTIRGHWGGGVNREFDPTDTFEWKHQIAPGEDAERFPQDGEFNGCSYLAGKPLLQDRVKLAFEPGSIHPQQLFHVTGSGIRKSNSYNAYFEVSGTASKNTTGPGYLVFLKRRCTKLVPVHGKTGKMPKKVHENTKQEKTKKQKPLNEGKITHHAPNQRSDAPLEEGGTKEKAQSSPTGKVVQNSQKPKGKKKRPPPAGTSGGKRRRKGEAGSSNNHASAKAKKANSMAICSPLSSQGLGNMPRDPKGKEKEVMREEEEEEEEEEERRKGSSDGNAASEKMQREGDGAGPPAKEVAVPSQGSSKEQDAPNQEDENSNSVQIEDFEDEDEVIFALVISGKLSEHRFKVTRRDDISFGDLRGQIEKHVTLPFKSSFIFTLFADDPFRIDPKHEKDGKEWSVLKYLKKGQGSFQNPYHVFIKETG